MNKYLIGWGVGGGYGGIQDHALIYANSYDDALREAQERSHDACEGYGLNEPDEDDEEYDELTESEKHDLIQEKLEQWEDYFAELWTGSEEQQDKIDGRFFIDETTNR